MRDPLEELRSLTRDLHATPLPAAEVRRRGDQRRRRWQLAGAATAAAMVALVASGGLAASRVDISSTPVAPATQGTAESGTPDPGNAAGEIPGDFPLTAGLPTPGGDIPPFTWSDQLAEPLRTVACDDLDLSVDDRRVDSRSVQMSAPAASAWRHLLLFPDEATAEQAFAEVQALGRDCVQRSPAATGDGVSEARWTSRLRRHAGDDVLTLRGLTYAAGSDTGVPGRSVTEVVQVGRGLLVARFDDEASTGGDDREQLSADAVDSLADAMCLFTDEGCGSDPAT